MSTTSIHPIANAIVSSLKFVLFAAIGVAFLFLTAYGVVFVKVYGFIAGLATNIYWIHSEVAASVAVLAASLVALPFLWALLRVAIAKGSGPEYALVAGSILLTLGAAYIQRDKYFRSGNDPLFVCAPVLPDDAATIEHLGAGEAEGRRCVRLTPENAAVARAIDRRKAPKLIQINSSEQVAMQVWFRNGTPAVYMGNLEDVRGLVKLYDGPGFDPDTPEFLVPISVAAINELRRKLMQLEAQRVEDARAAKERQEREAHAQAEKARLEKQAQDEEDARKQAEQKRREEQERLAQLERDREIRAEQARRDREARAQQAERERDARIELERRQQEVARVERAREARRQAVANSRRHIDMQERGAVPIPPGYWVVDHGASIYFMVSGQRRDSMSLDDFRRNSGNIVAVPQPWQYIFRKPNSDWMVIEMFPE